MLRTVLITWIVFASGFLFGQDKKDTIVIKTPTSCNHCKVCETCGQKLETDLYYVRGIKLVTYNEEAMTTTVVYKPQHVTPDKIREAIAKLGFDADNIAADPAGYAKRDGCCKK